MAKDLPKKRMVKALSLSLNNFVKELPIAAKRIPRTFGIQVSGYSVEFLEAQMEADDVIVVYKVGTCKRPKSGSDFSNQELSKTLSMFIALTERITRNLREVMEYKED